MHKSIKYGIWCKLDLPLRRKLTALQQVQSSAISDWIVSSEKALPRGQFFFYTGLYGHLHQSFTDKNSVNGSGHFAGIAEMLTPIDENTTSKVWANEYKGIFKLRWIFVKDVPNAALRHLRLTYVVFLFAPRLSLRFTRNTQEQKPVTSSRDTQEVPYAVGCEMLRIITSHTSKTSQCQFLWVDTR